MIYYDIRRFTKIRKQSNTMVIFPVTYIAFSILQNGDMMAYMI